MRSDCCGTVLDAGCLDDLRYFLSNVVERRDPASGLELDFLLKNFEFHIEISPYDKLFFI